MTDPLLTPYMVGKEFELQLRERLGGSQHVAAEFLEVPDAFGPARVLQVRWGKFTANLSPGRAVLSLSLEDYSRHFVQPQVEAWISRTQEMAR